MHKLSPRFLQCCAIGVCLLGPMTVMAQETKPAPSAASPALPDPNAWAVKVYRYPSSALTGGFVSRERGQVSAPPMPAANASAEEIVAFLKRSNDAVTQHLRYESVLLPQGSLAVFDPANQTLAVRTTNAMHDRIRSLADGYTAELPKYMTFSVRLLETDGKTVRDVVKECSTKADHTAVLKRLEGLVTQGQAKHLGLLRLETRSGQRAQAQKATDFYYLAEQAVDEKDQAATTQEMRKVGTNFEIDAVIGPDGETIDANFILEHHHTPPTMRWVLSGQRGARAIESPTPHFHTAKVTTATTLLSGMTKLVEVWKPNDAEGQPPADRLQMAFLKADIVSLLPALDTRSETLLKTHGSKVVPTPQAPAPESPDLPPGMVLRSFRIPPTFLSGAASGSVPDAPADPFSPQGATPMVNEPRISVRITALEVLKAQGIPFPPGSSANFTPSTAELLVRNTPENMALVEAYVQSIMGVSPRVIVNTVHIVQADGATLRKLEADSAIIADHTELWNAMEKEVAAGRAKVVRCAWLETRSGQRATFEGITEHIYASGTSYEKGGDEKGSSPRALQTEFEMRPVGLRFELDPVIGPDGVICDLNLSVDYDFAPPTDKREPLVADDKTFRFHGVDVEFHRANVTTAVTVHSGRPRLLGIWKPSGAPEFDGANAGDVMQAIFVRTDLVNVEREEAKP